MKEVISHYLNNESCVYTCLLDISKAFDRVHYGTLLNILLLKGIPKCIVRLVYDSYLKQKSCVIWKSVKSDLFQTCNGVKQGGVLSEVLFSMYIDLLFVELSNSGYGYHLGGGFQGLYIVPYVAKYC